jgi:hypothetical protein
MRPEKQRCHWWMRQGGRSLPPLHRSAIPAKAGVESGKGQDCHVDRGKNVHLMGLSYIVPEAVWRVGYVGVLSKRAP